jgi:hypothetical protein
MASAVCEAVVRRTREFVDPGDTAESPDSPKLAVNKTFGRRYQVVSYRWVEKAEL